MKRFSNWILAGVVWVLIHPSALACATCFGNSDSPMAKGMNAGIGVLLGVVGLLWLAFASFFVFIVQRSRQGGEPLPGEQNDPQHN